MKIPTEVFALMEKIWQGGQEAFLVGGCVRDALLGLTPKDFDIATSAPPEELKKILKGHTIIPTGIAFGTVTVMQNRLPVEVTTFRAEKGYRDFRHPDRVEFVSSIEEDLARRDFTMNAIAYHPKTGYVDPFGGRRDIERKQIQTVGNPADRFLEDPLRILRAVRFVSTLGFTIEEKTEQAIKEYTPRLERVSAERILQEMNRLLQGEDVYLSLTQYHETVSQVIPEARPMIGFRQYNPYHRHSVYEHTVRVVAETPADDLVLRWAALLHDIGKPDTFTLGEDGVGHFYSHARKSVELGKTVLQRLKAGRVFTGEVLTLVRYHDIVLKRDKKLLRRWLSRLGETQMFRLLKLRRADALGQGTNTERRVWAVGEMERMVGELLEEESCFSLADLDINGTDLMELGIPSSPEIGILLQEALDGVLEEEVVNQKEALLKYLKIDK